MAKKLTRFVVVSITIVYLHVVHCRNYFEYITATSSESARLYRQGGSVLHGEKFFSLNDQYMFQIQNNGNCVIKDLITDEVKWDTGTADFESDGYGGHRAALQNDGNFVVYSIDDRVLFGSKSVNGTSNAPYYLYLHDDGYLFILNKYGIQTWASDDSEQSSVLPTSFSAYDPLLVDIWTDDMTDGRKWVKFGGSKVMFDTASSNCQNPSGTCLRLEGDTSYVERTTDISAYFSVQFEVNFSLDYEGVMVGGNCSISYKYDEDEWISDHQYNVKAFYLHRRINFVNAASSNLLSIRLENNGDSANDLCYWDNLILRGREKTLSPTTIPTINPTVKPSLQPISNSTSQKVSTAMNDVHATAEPLEDKQSNDDNMILVGILLAVITICAVAMLVFLCKYTERERRKTIENENHMAKDMHKKRDSEIFHIAPQKENREKVEVSDIQLQTGMYDDEARNSMSDMYNEPQETIDTPLHKSGATRTSKKSQCDVYQHEGVYSQTDSGDV